MVYLFLKNLTRILELPEGLLGPYEEPPEGPTDLR